MSKMGACEEGAEKAVKKYITASPEETESLGAEVAVLLQAGDIVSLVGELGGGKTCFVRGFLKGLGQKGHVKSPSFNLLNIYDDDKDILPLYHMDLYRLTGEGDFFEAGLEEYIYSGGISVIEWADKVPAILENSAVVVRFIYLGESRREISVQKRGSGRGLDGGGAAGSL
ncbi:MAG: tRNA (adenosine(37)-N6)-threonylcarbamoyltransferase complex ATPase subunit type 1 TsaE [Thermodesulfobacteriota bacterium]